VEFIPDPSILFLSRSVFTSSFCLCLDLLCYRFPLGLHNWATVTTFVWFLSLAELKGPVGQILHSDKNVLAVEQNKVLVPPSYNKYVAWGFADHSLRVGNYDSDKAVFVCEAMMQSNGEIVACVCPSSKLIVTAGTSSVGLAVHVVAQLLHPHIQLSYCFHGAFPFSHISLSLFPCAMTIQGLLLCVTFMLLQYCYPLRDYSYFTFLF
jgi:hypothetical protein